MFFAGFRVTERGSPSDVGKVSDMMSQWCRKNTAKSPWLETPDEYAARLRLAASTINAGHDVDGLCREFPSRVVKMLERNRDRLRT